MKPPIPKTPTPKITQCDVDIMLSKPVEQLRIFFYCQHIMLVNDQHINFENGFRTVANPIHSIIFYVFGKSVILINFWIIYIPATKPCIGGYCRNIICPSLSNDVYADDKATAAMNKYGLSCRGWNGGAWGNQMIPMR